MIRNAKILEGLEKELVRESRADISANFRIVDALYQEAVSLGVIPLKDPLEGLETIIRLAKVVNSVPRAPYPDSTGTP